jgi:hypothetical protein
LANPYRTGSINLNLNTANNPAGNIVLGIWNGSTFTPSLDGTRVNAVQCRFATTVPTSFLRLVGINSLNTGAMAIAWAAQPATTPPNACVFPVALSSCFFGGATSLGCGATITLISSSDNSQLGANTAAWTNLVPNANNVNANTLSGQVQAAGNGNCQGTALNTGAEVPLGGGEVASVIKQDIKPIFQSKFASSAELVVFKQDGVTEAYRGKGWEVFVPVVDTGPTCPPGSQINQSSTITGWTRMVITQVLDKNGECAVENHWGGDPDLPFGNPWDSRCFLTKNGKAEAGATTVIQGSTGIFGYYDCTYTPAPPAPNPGPISATAKLKLVR